MSQSARPVGVGAVWGSVMDVGMRGDSSRKGAVGRLKGR